MKQLLVLVAFLSLSAASAIPKAGPPAQCFVQWDDNGQCMTGQQTWTFDNSIDTCRVIDMYGCVGSDNVFETQEECLSVCAAEQTETKAVETISNDAKLELFKFNSFIDLVFGEISSLMKTIGGDPIIVEGFEMNMIPNLTLGFKDGVLRGLSNIVRVGDWVFELQGISTYGVRGGLGVHDVEGHFTAIGEYSGHGGEVTVFSSINKFDVTFNVYANLALCTVGLSEFTLGEGMELDVYIDSGSFMDPVINEVIASAADYWTATFKDVIEQASLAALGSINVCELVGTLMLG